MVSVFCRYILQFLRESESMSRSYSFSQFVVLLVLIIGFFALLISLWIGLRMRETLIRFFFRLQEKVLPRAMHKMR